MSSYKGVRVLVTGASGFLGSHAVRALIEQGAEVHGLTRPRSRLDRLREHESDARVHRADLSDYPSILEVIRSSNPQIVFHLAGDVAARRSLGGWENVQRSIEINLLGTINVVRAAAESRAAIGRIVRVGGLEEYGRAPAPFVEGVREQPVSAYSAAQVAATHFCQALQPDLSFDIVTVRPALVYGPDQSRDFFIPQLIEACRAKKDFDMTEGTQSRDLLYIDDAIEGILLAGSAANLRGAVINLATGTEHTVRSVAEMIVRLTGASIQLNRGAKEASSGELQHLAGSTELAEKLLNWRARTSLEDGITRTIRSADASRP